MPAPLSHTTKHSSYGYTHMYTGYRVSAWREDMVGDWKGLGISSIRADSLDTRVWSHVSRALPVQCVEVAENSLPTHTYTVAQTQHMQTHAHTDK